MTSSSPRRLSTAPGDGSEELVLSRLQVPALGFDSRAKSRIPSALIISCNSKRIKSCDALDSVGRNFQVAVDGVPSVSTVFKAAVAAAAAASLSIMKG